MTLDDYFTEILNCAKQAHLDETEGDHLETLEFIREHIEAARAIIAKGETWYQSQHDGSRICHLVRFPEKYATERVLVIPVDDGGEIDG